MSQKKGYFQTWMYWARAKPYVGERIYRLGQSLCGFIGNGHEVSKTEWSYRGGEKADVWCRWCNQIGTIPVNDLSKRFENARATLWRFTGCDINRENFALPGNAKEERNER